MDASLAATGMLDVLATRAVRFMIDVVFPPTSIVSSGKSRSTWNLESKVAYLLMNYDMFSTY